ncbi:unnamed protein product [Symbiodinium microadriaticum]|nr:unnamed protein product [Symbiodinium microadriaticum]
MAELKTKPTSQKVTEFIDQVEDETKRDDSHHLLKILKEETGEDPVMWGPSIVGFGKYKYVYDSGRSGEWMLAGFSPRKQALTVYIMSGFEKFDDLLMKLGKHKTGKSCLYIKKLADIDEKILREMIRSSVAVIKKRYANT